MVPVRVNGQDFEFLVDTGSAYTGLAAPTAGYLGVVPQPTPGMRIARAHGPSIRVPTGRLEALSVGGHEVRNIDVLILELPSELRIDGLLGMDFLDRFRTTVEPDTATVILRAVRVADG